MVRLENWSVTERVTNNGPYDAPELLTRFSALHGDAYGHTRFDDGTRITSNRIVEIDIARGYARTASGTEYELGSINPDYKQWLDARNMAIDIEG